MIHLFGAMSKKINAELIWEFFESRGRGVDSAREELSRFRRPSISWITWMEVLVGASDPTEVERLKSFLSGFQIVAIDRSVSELAVEISREHRIALRDAIIQASAQAIGAVLVTRNTLELPFEGREMRLVEDFDVMDLEDTGPRIGRITARNRMVAKYG